MITSLLQKALRSIRTTLATLFPVRQDLQKAWQPIPIPVEQQQIRRQRRKQNRYHR